MNALRIHGGRRLTGEWRVHSAKNAVLPIMAASILTGEETRLEECPELVDVAYMADILRTLGCRIHSGDGALTIDPQSLNRHEMPDALAKKIRSSIFLLGSILARFRKATVTFPGGCEIGLRPIDLHLSGLRQLGVDVREEGGPIRCDGRHMRAGTVHFDYPSVGATENVMMAAALLKGRTVHPDVRCIVIPATQAIYLQAMDEGLLKIFIEAGAVVSTPTCGPCLGGYMGILAAGERCISTTNRNFVGRMGHVDSEVYLASPAVAAASAVTGKISAPEELGL